MCLVRVKQEEDVVVPYRVVSHSHSHRTRSRSPPRRRASHVSQRRVSRTEIVRPPSPARSRVSHHSHHSASYVAVPTPAPLLVPAPQPVPIFVEPPGAPSVVPSHHSHHTHHPPPPASHHGHGIVEVSPRSSYTSHTSSPSRSEYVIRERSYHRDKTRSPDRGQRYEHYRYVDAPPVEGSEDEYYDQFVRRNGGGRDRSRSRSRVGYDGGGRGRGREEDYREERVRISVMDEQGGGSWRRREYER